METPLDHLPARQRRSEDYQAARRAELAPLQARRRTLLATLEDEQTRFLASALATLTPAHLAPFDEAAKIACLDVIPSVLLERLRQRSEKASQDCRRYEREQNIYQLAETLPAGEEQLSRSQARLRSLARTRDQLEERLAPLLRYNASLNAATQTLITPEVAARYARAPGLRHVLRWLTSRMYRTMRALMAPLEQGGESVASQLTRLSQLRQELVVVEQNTELREQMVQEQRRWVSAYAEAWAQRLGAAQLKQAMIEALADQMNDPLVREHLAKHFDRRWPQAISVLYSEIGQIDAAIRGFIGAFARTNRQATSA